MLSFSYYFARGVTYFERLCYLCPPSLLEFLPILSCPYLFCKVGF